MHGQNHIKFVNIIWTVDELSVHADGQAVWSCGVHFGNCTVMIGYVM